MVPQVTACCWRVHLLNWVNAALVETKEGFVHIRWRIQFWKVIIKWAAPPAKVVLIHASRKKWRFIGEISRYPCCEMMICEPGLNLSRQCKVLGSYRPIYYVIFDWIMHSFVNLLWRQLQKMQHKACVMVLVNYSIESSNCEADWRYTNYLLEIKIMFGIIDEIQWQNSNRGSHITAALMPDVFK